jgi:hypothetical protein
LRVVNGINLAVRFFLLELGGLAAAAYCGLETGSGAIRWLLAVAAPLAFAVVWFLFIAPKARIRIPRLAALAIELALFGLLAAGLATTGHVALAIAFATLAVASGVLNFALRT